MNLSCDKIFTTLPQTLVVAYINPMSKLMDMVIQPSPSSSYMFYKLSNDKDKESSRDILFFFAWLIMQYHLLFGKYLIGRNVTQVQAHLVFREKEGISLDCIFL